MTKCEYPNCTCSPLRFAWLRNVSGQLGVFWLNKQRKIKIYPCGETERIEMPHDYRARADAPGRPEQSSNMDLLKKNPVPVGATGIPDERKPELLRYLDDMSYLEKQLWESLENLDVKLGPLLRKPQDTTACKRDRGDLAEHDCHLDDPRSPEVHARHDREDRRPHQPSGSLREGQVDNPYFAQLVAQELDRIAEAKKKTKEKLTGEQVVIGFFAFVMNVVMSGIFTCVMWHWFVVPKFHAPEFQWLQMIGLIMVVRVMAVPRGLTTPKSDASFEMRVAQDLVFPPLILFIGWVIHWLAIRGTI